MQAIKNPFLVLFPVTSDSSIFTCNKMYEVLSTRKACQRLSTQLFHRGLFIQGLTVQHVPKFQSPRRRAHVQCKLYCLCVNHTSQLGNEGMPLKFKFSYSSQGQFVGRLSKESSLWLCMLTLYCTTFQIRLCVWCEVRFEINFSPDTQLFYCHLLRRLYLFLIELLCHFEKFLIM